MEISFFSPGWKLAEHCNGLALHVSWDSTPGSSCTLSRKLPPSPAKLAYGVEVLVPRVSSWEVGLLMVCPHQWVLLMMEHLGCGEIWGWSLARDTGEWDSETLPWGPGKPFSTGCVRVCQAGFQKPPPRLPVLILRTERAEAP